MCYCDSSKRAPICTSCPPLERYVWALDKLGEVKKGSEPYVPMIGDRVSLEGEITAFPPDEELIDVRIDDRGVCMPWITVSRKAVKLLSRKSPRKITRKEIEEMVGGSFELID